MLLSEIGGIGEKRLAALNQLKIYTLQDALSFIPVRYRDFTHVTPIAELHDGEYALIRARMLSHSYPRRARNGAAVLNGRCEDASGTVNLMWFNQPYVFNRLKTGLEFLFYGKVSEREKRIFIINPVFETPDSAKMQGIEPVYAIPHGSMVSQNLLRTVISKALEMRDPEPELLPDGIRRDYSLPQRDFALENIHFPQNTEALDAAKRRISFEELLIFLTSLRLIREKSIQRQGTPLICGDREEYLNRLPFTLTAAQLRSIDEIKADISGGGIMNRLLQGDVGSGKTAVAFYCAFTAFKNNRQCAIMAPTELLARQHFKDFTTLFPEIHTVLLTGSLKSADRAEAAAAVADGSASVIIGTHAVLTETIVFSDLAVVVTDEQHRFGVFHRALLDKKGSCPHTLVMSATPIPRTLALILYKDLQLSVLDQLPPGRLPVSTHIIPPSREDDMYAYIKQCAAADKRTYIVCPLIEDSDAVDCPSAQELYKDLSNGILSGVPIALLHGRQSSADKQKAMDDFISGAVKVLVSTTVIEVGVNVPQAVNMVVVGADRFGLSQLHQLRGRVGRAGIQSYCFLLSAAENERLEIMKSTTDGFKVAQEDLRLRGPGDYLGVRQSGAPSTMFASAFADMNLVKQAEEALAKIFVLPEYSIFRAALSAAASKHSDKALANIIYN